MEKRVFVYMVLFLGCIACTGHFKDLNTDKTGITDEDTRIDWNHIGIPLGVVQQGIYFNYDFGKGKNWTYQWLYARLQAVERRFPQFRL